MDHPKKRTKTLMSFFSPAPTPVILPTPRLLAVPVRDVQVEPETPDSETVVQPETLATATRVSNVDGDIDDDIETEEVAASNDPNVVLNEADIVADPGLRIPIENMHPNIRDAARRAYILKGPCQPKGHNYPRRMIYNRNRSFHDEWFTNNPWLEYSVAKDAAFCFYCYLFKQPRVENFGVEAFTSVGFRGWKDGRELIRDHGTSKDHNKSRKCYEAFKNQRQSVSHAIDRGGKKTEEEHKGRLVVVVEIIRFLLLQALAFRGHDESSSSSNRGVFLEFLEWWKEKDNNVAYLFRKNQMTSHDIQKDICRACAEQTIKAIISDLGERHFAILVDEARDASIKEQMAFVLRYVNARGEVIERFLGLKEVADTSSLSLKMALDVLAKERSKHCSCCGID
ncbi:unnamed protein product [Urochloa humidicola]